MIRVQLWPGGNSGSKERQMAFLAPKRNRRGAALWQTPWRARPQGREEVKASYLFHGSRTRWGLLSRHTHWGDEGGGRLGGRNGWMDLVGHRINGKSARKK